MAGYRSALGRVCLLLVMSAVGLSAGGAAASAATVQKQGYIPMADGTQLEYTVDLPPRAASSPLRWSTTATARAPAR